MTTGFVPPEYPQDRLNDLRATANAQPGGLIDCSVGTPVDPLPEIARQALVDALPDASGYPVSIGSRVLRDAAAGWVQRRFGVAISAEQVIASVGTKEVVAGLPRWLSFRNPTRDTVLYPAVSYPTYEMGARLAGLRAVPIPVDDRWHLDLSRIDPADADRALLLWLNDPSNPTGAVATAAEMRAAVEWGRSRGIIVASDECYAEFTADDVGNPAPPVTALTAGTEGVLAVHSLSKRSNMAGLRVGFVAGDEELVGFLGLLRRHAGFMVPSPVQAAGAAVLADDAHVDEQRKCYAQRRAALLPPLEERGLVHDGGMSGFYLWLREVNGDADGWAIAARLAERGLVVAPGDLYGPSGARHVRLALCLTDAQVDVAVERLRAL